MARETARKQWGEAAAKRLEGRTITAVCYMTGDETKAADWHASALVLILDDGNFVFPMRDDEGNGPGALATSFDDLPTLPVV